MHNEVLGNRGEFETSENVFDEFNTEKRETQNIDVVFGDNGSAEYVAPVMPDGMVTPAENTEMVTSEKGLEDGNIEEVVFDLMGRMKNDPAGFNDEINNICNGMSQGNEY